MDIKLMAKAKGKIKVKPKAKATTKTVQKKAPKQAPATTTAPKDKEPIEKVDKCSKEQLSMLLDRAKLMQKVGNAGNFNEIYSPSKLNANAIERVFRACGQYTSESILDFNGDFTPIEKDAKPAKKVKSSKPAKATKKSKAKGGKSSKKIEASEDSTVPEATEESDATEESPETTED